MTDNDTAKTIAGRAERRIARRGFVRLATMGVAGMALAPLIAACGGSSTSGTTAPTTAAGGAAPTTAPGGAAPTATGAAAGGYGANAPAASPTVAATTGASGASPVTGSPSASPATRAATAAASPRAGGALATAQPAANVEIEYWQYQFPTKVDLVNQLITEFQTQNPKIKVKHVNFPYDDFRQKVAAAVQAGEGPDVLNVYYGWLPAYVQQKYLVPLPEQYFPAAQIESGFFPMVKTAQFKGQFYALPTAVRTLALFYNQDLLKAASKDVPKTWEDFVSTAQATTKRTGDKLEIAGATYDPGGQGHLWWRECLNRQNGLVPMSPDFKKVRWAEPPGVEAFTWYMDLVKKYKVGEPAFYTDGATAFQTGHAALHVDGSFRLGTLAAVKDLNWGVAPLPMHKDKASFASFWCNTITRKAKDDKLIAAAKFIDFLASPDVMRRWTPKIGELPARVDVAQETQFTKDPKLGAFIEQLPYAYATFFVNEADDRKAVLDAFDQVLLNNVDPKTAVTDAAGKVQQMLDDYWASVS